MKILSRKNTGLPVKAALVLLLFTMVLSKVSATFDTDSGWQLRFGQDAMKGNFQYLDSYTWGHYGQPWVNFSWGGDILYWLIFSNFGHGALVVIFSVVATLGFLVMNRLVENRFSVIGLLVSIISYFSVRQLLTIRLALFSPLFFGIILYTLEKIPEKKLYRFWPLLFFLWGAVHGSWIIGLVLIAIYFLGNYGQRLWKRHHPAAIASSWRGSDYRSVAVFSVLSVAALLVNPYGIGLFGETFALFTESFYKQVVIEWMPSTALPVYWLSIIHAVLIIFFAIQLFFSNKLSFTRFFLVVALFFSAMLYKRNMIFLIFVGIPLLTAVGAHVLAILNEKLLKNNFLALIPGIRMIVKSALLLSALIGVVYLGSKIDVSGDFNTRRRSFARFGIPFEASSVAKEKFSGNKVFADFIWNGYLEWVAPEARYFIDGRSVVTWKDPTSGKGLLQKYYDVLFKPEGLKFLEKNGVKYVMLMNSSAKLAPEYSWADRIFFGEELNRKIRPIMTMLEEDLKGSKEWKNIYSDKVANIWERQ